MDPKSANIPASVSSPGPRTLSIWSRLIELMGTFDSPQTRHYVGHCISLAERIASQTEPLVSPTELLVAIQSELPIPITSSSLPPTGLLGLCVNLATITCHVEEDPIEDILRIYSERGIDATCYPGAHDR
jgi:hypothetical protein